MAMRIIGIDHGSKETLVKECGAEVFIDVTKFDDKTIAEEVKKVTGGTFPRPRPKQIRLFSLHAKLICVSCQQLIFAQASVHLL